jgi:hypothetical protein
LSISHTIVRGALAGILAAVVLPAAAAATPHYSAKLVGNDGAGGRVAEHHFVVGDGYTGVFRDNRHARVRYRACLYRGGARLSCTAGRTGRVGVDDAVFLIAPQQPGSYVYRWLVRGRPVVSWSVTIGIGD